MGQQVALFAKAQMAAALLTAIAIFGTHAAVACGYHDPSTVARGVMNLVYPKALYVRTAVWQAQRIGVLPPRSRRPVKDLFAYQRAVSNVQTLGSRLTVPNGEGASFAVVLLDSMLWARFVAGSDGYAVSVHVKGPEEGDVVLVTEAEVIGALVSGSLDISVAEDYGLFLLYGPAVRQAEIRSALAGGSVERGSAASPTPNSEGEPG